MLHLNTINETMHQVLLSLLDKDYLKNFSLVGGTSLSLRYGHRKSIDIDLFSPNEFTPSSLDQIIKIDFPDYVYRGNNRYMLFCDIGPVKTDIIYHPFALLSPVETIDNIRMFSIEDVAAMKLFAICKRGTKKDFYDVRELLRHFTAKKLTDFFVDKYGEEKLIFLKKSVVYFEEADDSEQPEILTKDLKWEQVKKTVYTSFISL
jgi:predicted nucleotidyltransferase component of viral defense system